MQLPDLMNVLQRYTGASPADPPAEVQSDFQQVAQHALSNHLATGLSEAFRSDQTPPFGNMVANMFGQSNGEQKAGILNQLISAAGPAVLSSGVLGGLSGLLGSRGQITPDQASQVPAETVQQIAEHAQKADPSIIDQASGFYAKHPTLVQALGAGSLALIMSRMSRS